MKCHLYVEAEESLRDLGPPPALAAPTQPPVTPPNPTCGPGPHVSPSGPSASAPVTPQPGQSPVPQSPARPWATRTQARLWVPSVPQLLCS